MGGLGQRPWQGLLLLSGLLASPAMLWGQEEAPGPPPPFPEPAGEVRLPSGAARKPATTPPPAVSQSPAAERRSFAGGVFPASGGQAEAPLGPSESRPLKAGVAGPVVEQHTFRLLHPLPGAPAGGTLSGLPTPPSPASSSYLPPGPPGSLVPATSNPLPGPVRPRTGSALLPTLILEQRGPQTLKVGQTGRYEFLVRNVGTLPATDLHLEVELPAGVQLRQSAPAAAVAGQRLHWLLPFLAAGEERHYQVELQALTPGEQNSRARLILSLAEVQNILHLLPPGLKLQLRGPTQAQVGDKIEVHIVLVNEAGQPLPGVLVRATLPEGLQHESGPQIEAGPFTVETSGKDISLWVRAVRPGPQELQVVAGGGAWEVQERLRIPVQEAAARPPAVLHLSKRGSNRLRVGEVCDYELQVRNSGSRALSEVSLRDQLPAGLDFVSATAGGRYDAARHQVEWHLGMLGPQQQYSVQVRVRAQRVGEQRNPVSARGEPDCEAHLTAVMQVDNPERPAAGAASP